MSEEEDDFPFGWSDEQARVIDKRPPNQPTPEPTIKRLDLNDPVVKREFLRILARINKQFKPLTDAIRESQRITAKDLAITITNQERRK